MAKKASAQRVSRGLIYLAAFGGFFGLIGLVLQQPFWHMPSFATGVQALLDALYGAVRFFILEGPRTVDQSGEFGFVSAVFINLGRFLAPISLAGAFVSVFAQFWRPWLDSWRLSRLQNHIIVLGAGPAARAFIHNALAAKIQTVCFVFSPLERDELALTFGRAVLIMVGDPHSPRCWQDVNASQAQTLVLLARRDGENLAIMQVLKQHMFAKVDGGVGGEAEQSVHLLVHIGDESLRHNLIQDPTIFTANPSVDIQPFGIDELAARYFFKNRDFFMETRARGFTNVHWAIFGLNNASKALIKQFLRVSAFPGLGKPRLSLMVPDQVSRLAAEAFVKSACGGPDLIADFTVHLVGASAIGETGGTAGFADISADLMQKTAAHGPVSTIFIGVSAIDQGWKMAMQIKAVSAQTGLCKCPIYVREKRSGANPVRTDSNKILHGDMDTAQGVEIFADPLKYCDTRFLRDAYDAVAQSFHAAYAHNSDAESTADKPALLSQWQQLDESYKIANRRAADHAKTKLEYLGFSGGSDALTYDHREPMAVDKNQREALARAEHESWCADRILNGWIYGARRDNAKKVHPSLRAYDDLSPELRDLDRDQIDQLIEKLVKPDHNPALKKYVRIGLIGHNAISLVEADHIMARLRQDILPDLADQTAMRHLTFVTPLAPGTDVTMATTILEHFAPKSDNWDMQIVQTMPVNILVDHYAHNWQDEVTWDGRSNNSQPVDWANSHPLICTYLNDVAHQNERVKSSVDLMPPYRDGAYWTDAEKCTAAFVRGAAHMGASCDILIAYLDESREPGAGGTAHSLGIASGNGAQIIRI